MNDKWKQLIEELAEKGYTPYDIERIVMTYEMMMSYDVKIKKLYEDEANERDNSDSLHHD
jgi:Fic family protein